MNLSRKTLLIVGHALETSAAIHVMNHEPDRLAKLTPKSKHDPYVNTAHKACEEALVTLRRSLRLPKTFSFTTARMAAYDHEFAQWRGRMRRRPTKTKKGKA